MITNQELKTHFGHSYEYNHAVTLRDRANESKPNAQTSLDWAKIEAQKVKEVIPWVKSGAEGCKVETVEHFERTLEILEELIKQKQ